VRTVYSRPYRINLLADNGYDTAEERVGADGNCGGRYAGEDVKDA
jgi:hypothetical protein